MGFWPSTSLFFPCVPIASPLLPYTNFLFQCQGLHACSCLYFTEARNLLTLAPGDNHPVVEEDDRLKEFLFQHNWVLWLQSQNLLQALTFSSTGSHLFSSRRLEIIFSPSFPLRFLICWFLFHILILPCNTDIYYLSFKCPYFPIYRNTLRIFHDSLTELWVLNLLHLLASSKSLITCASWLVDSFPCCSWSVKFILSLLYCFSFYPLDDSRVLGSIDTCSDHLTFWQKWAGLCARRGSWSRE